MTDHDIRNYLEKIYNVKVADIRSQIVTGKLIFLTQYGKLTTYLVNITISQVFLNCLKSVMFSLVSNVIHRRTNRFTVSIFSALPESIGKTTYKY